MPGCIIGMARLNRPSIFIYGGSIKPSSENTDYVTVCEKTGEFSKGELDESELIHVEKVSVKGPWFMRWDVHSKYYGFCN